MLGHDKAKPETYDTNGEDHITDALVYALMARPWTPSRPEAPAKYDGYRHDDDVNTGWTA